MEPAPAQPDLNELWAGHIFGTNTGKVFLQLTGPTESLTGTLLLADHDHGSARLEVAGSFQDGILSLVGRALEAPESVQFGQVRATARLQPNGQLIGQWETDQRTGGTFHLFPHLSPNQLPLKAEGPEQFYTVARDLGSLRLYREDVLELVRLLERDFSPARVIVSHTDRGTELSRFASDFVANVSQLDRLEWIKLTVQAPHPSGINRVATVDLGQAFNRVTTQGSDESWVLGEAESLSSHLRKRERRLSTTLDKYRVGLNQVIALGALIAMPELALRDRAIFVVAVLAFLIAADKAQRTLIPNLTVQLAEAKPGWLAQAWPSILSWLISMTAGVAASVLYGLLAKQ